MGVPSIAELAPVVIAEVDPVKAAELLTPFRQLNFAGCPESVELRWRPGEHQAALTV